MNMNINKELETLIYNEIKNNFQHEFLDDKGSFTVSIQDKVITIDNLVDSTDESGDSYDEDDENFDSEEDYIAQQEQNLYEFEYSLEKFVEKLLIKNGYKAKYKIKRV